MTNEELIEEVNRYYSDNFEYLSGDQPTLSILTNVARHFAEWQKEQMLEWAKQKQYESLTIVADNFWQEVIDKLNEI